MVWWWLFAFGVQLAERTPPKVLYGLARLLAALLATVPTRARAQLRRNLAQVTGLDPASEPLAGLTRQVYDMQVANYLDLMRSRRITPEEIRSRYTLEGSGWGDLVRTVRGGQGCVLVTPHFGRIELLNHVLALHGLPTTLPVERLKPERLFALVTMLRATRGVHFLPQDGGVRPWLRALGQGHVIALFAEWHPSGQGVPVTFFGRDSRFPPGPAFLALRGNAPLFIGYDLPGEPGDSRGRGLAFLDAPLHLARTGDLDADVQRGTQLIADHFQRRIGQHPGRWVMFHDMWPDDVSQSATTRAVEAAATE